MKRRIVCTTLLVETSPQAMPLGAACIASAIKASPKTAGAFFVELVDFSLEDDALRRLLTDAEKAVYLARALVMPPVSAVGASVHGTANCTTTISGQTDGAPSAICFSVYVWNHRILEAVAQEVKKLLPDCVCIAGGPEVTANPKAFTGFDYTIAGQGEGAVPALLAELFLADDAEADARKKPIAGVYALAQDCRVKPDNDKGTSPDNSKGTPSADDAQSNLPDDGRADAPVIPVLDTGISPDGDTEALHDDNAGTLHDGDAETLPDADAQSKLPDDDRTRPPFDNDKERTPGDGRAGAPVILVLDTGISPGDTPSRALPCLPDELASPYLDGTLDPAKYDGALWELARGCPFKCSYCYESKGEQKIAYFPLARLEKEIELFAKKNVPQVFVLDPTYNANKQRAIAMIRTIAKKAPGMFFYFEARAEFIDRELARAFATIPCALQIGLQSADPAVLKNVHRTLDKKLFTRNIGYLNDAGVTFGFDLIYGLPGDTYAGFCRSIDFALSLYPNNLELFCLSVLPGTTLYDDAAGFGLEWEREPPYHVLRTPQFSADDMARAERLARAVNVFYNEGRAVPWFNAVLFPLHMRASAFFEAFADYRVEPDNDSGWRHNDNGARDNDNGRRDNDRAARGNDKGMPATLVIPVLDTGISALQDYRVKPDNDSGGRNNDKVGQNDDRAARANGDDIDRAQLDFVRAQYRARHLEKLLPVVEDVISMNNALSRCTATGAESHLTLRYHPDDLMSEYATDIAFFAKHCGKQTCRVHVFSTKNGADWCVL